MTNDCFLEVLAVSFLEALLTLIAIFLVFYLSMKFLESRIYNFIKKYVKK